METEQKQIKYYNRDNKCYINATYPEECLEILRKERLDDWRIEYQSLEYGHNWCKHVHPLIMVLRCEHPILYSELNTMLDQLDGPYSRFEDEWRRNRDERIAREMKDREEQKKLMQKQQEIQKQKQEELQRKRKEQMGSRYDQYHQIKLDIFRLSNEIQEISSQISICEERINEKRPKLIDEEKKKESKNKTYNKKKHDDAIAFIEKYNQKLKELNDILTPNNEVLIQLKENYEQLKKEHDDIIL
jgi:DNA repair exonuclease SbcCD ATPase subunit